MPVLIDSNIVLDVVTVNPIIYAELCTGAASNSEVDELLESLKLGVQEIPREGLLLSAKAFLLYRIAFAGTGTCQGGKG
jgi:hypothetical protein